MNLEPAIAAPPRPASSLEEAEAESRIFVASQWQLIWWKFRKHRLAVISAVVVALIYLVALFAEFLAPYDPNHYAANYTYAPPHMINVFYNGRFVGPYLFGYKDEIDPQSFSRIFTEDHSHRIFLGLFVQGDPYKLWGIFPSRLHLFGPVDPNERIYLLGADHLGNDLLSRLIYGTRISMSIGLVGVAFSLILGIILGGISGYYGGRIDELIQRVIDFLRSMPTIPLWLGIAAAVPSNWPPLQVYFAITLILSLIGWTGLARVVRGRFLSLREEDFVMAARLDGASERRIIFRHMVPSFLSHIIASVTLAIPAMILGETALSFLGLGLQPPVVSWGVLLQDAQNVRAVATAPWLLIPAFAVVITVLAMNFLGDGLRDAADPYGR